MEDKLTKNIKKDQKLKMRKLWIQEQNTLPEGMNDKISIHKRSIKDVKIKFKIKYLNNHIKNN